MAKSSRGGRRGGSISQSHTGAVVTGMDGGASNKSYSTMSDTDALNMITANANSYQDPEFMTAQKMYISDAVDSQGYSFSQNLNYKLDNNLPLNANEKWINDNLQNGMHDLGKNTELVRYCHDDILKSCGINDYTKLSDSQLQSKLVGMELKTTSYMSTSYDANRSPFSPNALFGGGREVVMNVKASSKVKVALGAKSQSEVILNKGSNLKIVGVHYDGSYATPRIRSSSVPRIVIDIEAY